MDEMIVIDIMKKVMLVAGVVGILAGIDLLLGAKIVTKLKKSVDSMSFNTDKFIIKISSLFRETVDSGINIDDKITSDKTRVILGVLFIVLSICMIYVLRNS